MTYHDINEKNAGIHVYIDSQHSKLHDKIIIIDRDTVITGSYNFSRAAEERNSENILFIKSKGIAEKYLNNWHRHKAHSDK